MASISLRSSGRTEVLTMRSLSLRRPEIATQHSKHDSILKTQQAPNVGRKKRGRELTESEDKVNGKKKARVTVEISPPPNSPPKTRSLVKPNANSDDFLQRSAQSQKQPTKATQTEPPPPPPRRPTTNHHEKVVNGIKHELDRLGPNQVDLKDDKRKLRSQEGTRFKSDLAIYFIEYDEVIGNEPKEDQLLNIDTPMVIVDSGKASNRPQPHYPLKEFPNSLFHDLNEASRVDFSFLDTPSSRDGEGEDSLTDEYFGMIHRKPERSEKGYRNTDKGKAQHEKDQVIRLLEGLQGPDWLKLMGVSGITESKKRDYEPARAHFIKGCQGLLEKFNIWRDEEKRRKKKKEEIAMAEPEGPDAMVGDDSNISDGDPPDYSDADASAARQLHDEAMERAASLRVSRSSGRRAKADLIPLQSYPMEKDFTSFFAKSHLRPAEVKQTRRSGRSKLAWGQPIPEIPDLEFDLPEEFRDEDTLKAHARRKRRDRRVSKE